jgi:hypothetical protein
MPPAHVRAAHGAAVFLLAIACGACSGAATQSTEAPLISDTHATAATASSSGGGGASGAQAHSAPPAQGSPGQPETLATFTPRNNTTGSSPATQGAGATASPPNARPDHVPGTAIHFTGGDGAGVDHAVVIEGAHNEVDGTDAEYQYVAMLYGPQNQAWRLQQQALLAQNGHHYDRLDIALANGATVSVYFDISQFFGQF